jgi:kynurenine formamidase
MRIVDLSAPIAQSPSGTPEFQSTSITYYDHADGADEIRQLFGVTPELLRDGEGWTRETLVLGTHNSTHVDAPYHYNSHIHGDAAPTVDELPLEWFFGPGVVLDFSDHADGQAVDADDLRKQLGVIDHDLKPGDIVLLRTGRDAFYEQPDYIERGPGVTADGTRWLFDSGVRVMGVDAWGWDRPLSMQAADALDRATPGVFWEAHQAGIAYSQIERLVNLGSLPRHGFMVACFPLRIVGASAGPARVVAIFED